MKKLDSVQQTLIDMGFVIDDKNENYILGEVAIPAVEIVGHTVGSFLEKGKRRGWFHEEQMGVGKSMLLEPGMICKNNVVHGNSGGGIQVGVESKKAGGSFSILLNGFVVYDSREEEGTLALTKIQPVVGHHTMGIRTVEEIEDSRPHGCVPGVGSQCGCIERAKQENDMAYYDDFGMFYGFWTSVD